MPAAVHPALAAVIYRWAMVIAALASAALNGPPTEGISVVMAVLMMLGASSIITAVGVTKPAVLTGSARTITAILVGDLLIGGFAVATTGGAASPFVTYLTAPLMAFAVHGGTFTFVAAMFMTGATYLTSAWVWADGLPLSIAVDELVLMTLAPAMVRVGWFRGTAESRPMEFRLNDLDFELLRYLQAGLTYDQIADRRNVSTESTKVAISRLYRRLGARSRDDAVNIAHLRKMI